MASEVDEFLAEMVPRQVTAERATYHGDVEPRMAIWSTHDPVSMFGRGGTGEDGVG